MPRDYAFFVSTCRVGDGKDANPLTAKCGAVFIITIIIIIIIIINKKKKKKIRLTT